MNNMYQKLSIASILIVILSGCVGAGLRSGMTDKATYQETLASIPDIATGKGRIFIYTPKGGPNIISTLGVIDFISIDKDIFRFGGESYFYLDIDTGSHQATITEVVKKSFASNAKQYGKNKINITVPKGDVVYMRIVPQNSNVYKLEMVPKSKAESEMTGLLLWTNSITTMKIE